jgi:predicted house-cleaning noncanonical NTP pyrophosphatase (MazG superfamily)
MNIKPKLVRHKIPKIIEEDGKVPVIRHASNLEMNYHLFAKFIEEIQEFFEEPSAEEAADILEVLRSTCAHYDIEMSQVEKTAEDKYEERGGFFAGIILEDVKDIKDV